MRGTVEIQNDEEILEVYIKVESLCPSLKDAEKALELVLPSHRALL